MGHAKLFSQYATTPTCFAFWDKPESHYNQYGDHIAIDHFLPPTIDSPFTGTSSTMPPLAVILRHKAKKSKNKHPTVPINPLTHLSTALLLIQDMLFVATAAETHCHMYVATCHARRHTHSCNHTPHHIVSCPGVSTATITTLPDNHPMTVDDTYGWPFHLNTFKPSRFT
jgi:hypothetical protein